MGDFSCPCYFDFDMVVLLIVVALMAGCHGAPDEPPVGSGAMDLGPWDGALPDFPEVGPGDVGPGDLPQDGGRGRDGDVGPQDAGALDLGLGPPGEPCPLGAGVGVQVQTPDGVVCALAPGDLCGELVGYLAPGEFRLTCPCSVPAGQALVLTEGVRLSMGDHPLVVQGELSARDAGLVRVGSGGLVIRDGGSARLAGGYALAGAAASEAMVTVEPGGVLHGLGFDLRDPGGLMKGLVVHGTAALDGCTFAGPWVCLHATGEARVSVTRGRFLACGTSVMAEGPISLDGVGFRGGGFHLWLDPDGMAESDLRGLDLVGGTGLVLSGTLTRDLIVPAEPYHTLYALGLVVDPAGRLTLQGPGLAFLGEGLLVSGELVATGVAFTSQDTTTLSFSEGASGSLSGCSVTAGGGGAGPLVAVDGSSPGFESTSFEGPHGTGLLVSGPGAAPDIVGCTFRALDVGVLVRGGARPHMVDNRFEGVGVPVDTEDSQGQER